MAEEHLDQNKSRLSKLTSMYDRIPENDTSIPFTVYGKSISFFPLNRMIKMASTEWSCNNGENTVTYTKTPHNMVTFWIHLQRTY